VEYLRQRAAKTSSAEQVRDEVAKLFVGHQDLIDGFHCFFRGVDTDTESTDVPKAVVGAGFVVGADAGASTGANAGAANDDALLRAESEIAAPTVQGPTDPESADVNTVYECEVPDFAGNDKARTPASGHDTDSERNTKLSSPVSCPLKRMHPDREATPVGTAHVSTGSCHACNGAHRPHTCGIIGKQGTSTQEPVISSTHDTRAKSGIKTGANPAAPAAAQPLDDLMNMIGEQQEHEKQPRHSSGSGNGVGWGGAAVAPATIRPKKRTAADAAASKSVVGGKGLQQQTRPALTEPEHAAAVATDLHANSQAHVHTCPSPTTTMVNSASTVGVKEALAVTASHVGPALNQTTVSKADEEFSAAQSAFYNPQSLSGSLVANFPKEMPSPNALHGDLRGNVVAEAPQQMKGVTKPSYNEAMRTSMTVIKLDRSGGKKLGVGFKDNKAIGEKGVYISSVDPAGQAFGQVKVKQPISFLNGQDVREWSKESIRPLIESNETVELGIEARQDNEQVNSTDRNMKRKSAMTGDHPLDETPTKQPRHAPPPTDLRETAARGEIN
jgi:hypothetical protein